MMYCIERDHVSLCCFIQIRAADMLRLNWEEAMNDLVADWTQKKRFEDFIELESNVRAYVNKNLIDLTCEYDHRARTKNEWERGDQSVALSDRMRFSHFPYESVINSAVRDAISGTDILTPIASKFPWQSSMREFAYCQTQGNCLMQ